MKIRKKYTIYLKPRVLTSSLEIVIILIVKKWHNISKIHPLEGDKFK